MIRIDASDFNNLARDLTRAAASDLVGDLAPAMNKGALNIKEEMVGDMLSSPHFKGVARDISYDVDRFTNHIRAEVGPVTAGRTAGDLAHIAYFGGSPGGGGSVPDPEYLLAAEAPNLEDAIGDILERLL